MVDADKVIADAHAEGYQAATNHMLPVHDLWERAEAAWSIYWQRPEIAELAPGWKGTIGSMYLVAYAVGFTQRTFSAVIP